MKKNWINHTLAIFVLSLIGLPAFAQGLLIEKKDGSQIKVPYGELDYVTVYDADQPNNEDSILPDRYSKLLVAYSMVDSTIVSQWGPEVYRRSYSFTYDDKGRIQKEISHEYEWEDVTTYKWHGNQVEEIDNYEKGTYTIENGKLVSYVNRDGDMQYHYDGNGQFVKYEDNNRFEPQVIDLTWEKDRVVSWKDYYFDDYEATTYTFEYDNDKTCQAHFPMMYYPFEYNNFLMLHPCFLGKLMNHLPSRLTFTGDKGSYGEILFTYEYDTEGYVTKCIMKENSMIYDEDEQELSKYINELTYTYTWK